MSSWWRIYLGPETQLRLWVAISVVVVECLIAIWAARSRWHWFWRAAAVWAGIMALVPIRAWEPAWLFGLSSPLIVLFVRGGECVERRYFPTAALLVGPDERMRYRFSLLDLLLFMLMVGMWLRGLLEIVRHWHPGNGLGWLVTGASVAVVASCAYACTRIPRRWEHAGLVALGLTEVLVAFLVDLPWLGMIAALAGVVAYFYAFDRRHWLAVVLLVVTLLASAAAMMAAGEWMRWRTTIVNDDQGQPFLVLLLAEVAFAICMMVVVALVQVAISQRLTLRWRFAASLAVLLVFAGLVVPTGKVYCRMLALTPREAPVTRFKTSINHHDEILQLAKQIGALDPKPLGGTMTKDGWRDIWRSTSGPPAMQLLLDELKALLDAPNAMPYDPQTDAQAAYDGHGPGWVALVRSLIAEAKVSATAQEYEQSARLSLAIVRLGDMFSRGGIASDARMGDAVRKIGHAELMHVIDRLSNEELRQVLAVLQRSRADREEISAVLARQADFDEQVFGWHARFEQAVVSSTVAQNLEFYNSHVELEVTTNSLLQTHVAIRMFQSDFGRLPVNLSELVPAYLASSPVDPNSLPLCYRVAGEEFVLYSVGWDKKDDGGNFTTDYRYWATVPGSTWPQDASTPKPAFDVDLGMLTREERVEEVPPPIEEPPPSPPEKNS